MLKEGSTPKWNQLDPGNIKEIKSKINYDDTPNELVFVAH